MLKPRLVSNIKSGFSFKFEMIF